jgi:hypothetical protein
MNKDLDVTAGPWTVIPEYDGMTGVFLIREIRQEADAVEELYERNVELADAADAKRLERVQNAAKLIAYAEPMYQLLRYITRTASMKGPAGTTAFIIPLERMEEARGVIANIEEGPV